MCVCLVSCVQLFGTPWAVDRQPPLFLEFSRVCVCVCVCVCDCLVSCIQLFGTVLVKGVCVCLVSGIQLFGPQGCVCVCVSGQLPPTVWDPIDCSPPSSSVHGNPRQEYWSRWPCPPPGDLPNPGIKPEAPESSALWEDSLSTESPRKPNIQGTRCKNWGPRHSQELLCKRR